MPACLNASFSFKNVDEKDSQTILYPEIKGGILLGCFERILLPPLQTENDLRFRHL